MHDDALRLTLLDALGWVHAFNSGDAEPGEASLYLDSMPDDLLPDEHFDPERLRAVRALSLPHELDEVRRSLDAAMAALDHHNPGTWEAGPAPDECCASCGAWVDPTKAQFLGISNGDWAWCCSLRCLIAEAQGEQEFYTDGVGPQEPPVE